MLAIITYRKSQVTTEAKKTLCSVSLIIFGKMAESFGQVVGNKTIACGQDVF